MHSDPTKKREKKEKEEGGKQMLEAGKKKELFVNWAGIHSSQPRVMHRPKSVVDIRAIVLHVAAEKSTVKVVGSGHSPSDIAQTSSSSHMINLQHFRRVLAVDRERCLITVEAGATLHEINEALAKQGLAMPCLGSISEQTISGAISTGTHGTGVRFGPIHSILHEMHLMDAAGVVHELSERSDPELFRVAKCGLGALGIILQVTLQVQPAFRLHEVQFPKPLTEVLDSLDDIKNSGDHARFWWFPHTQMTVVCQQTRTEKPRQVPASNWLKDTVFGYYMLEGLYYAGRFVPSIIPLVNRTYQHVLFGERKERIDQSNKVFNFDCLFKQYVNEWSIPAENCAPAMRDLQAFIDRQDLRVHFPIEVRFVKGDRVPLSPAYGRDSCYIGIIMYKPYGTSIPFKRYFEGYAEIMLRYQGRPHWAKEFSLTPAQLEEAYPEWKLFLKMRQRLDPTHLFTNAYLDRYFPRALQSKL